MFTGNARALLASLVVFGTVAATACSDGSADGNSHAAETEVARTVCGRLRTYTNDLVKVANDTVTGINTLTPEQRTAAILVGFDNGLEVARGHAELVDQLELDPAVAESESLHDVMVAGAANAIDELTDERAAFEREVPTVQDDDVAGRTSQFFNAFEKAMSVTEPAIAVYHRRALSEAFLGEPTCRHVIQQFRIDD